MTDIAGRIDTFLEERLNDYIDETAKLCRVPSVSAKADRAVMAECAGLVASILERHGFEVQQFETPGNPIVVGPDAWQGEQSLGLSF
jgi:acetylornithine deacetylase/succinyl-diaminopimelate desuccinylase-like protein